MISQRKCYTPKRKIILIALFSFKIYFHFNFIFHSIKRAEGHDQRRAVIQYDWLPLYYNEKLCLKIIARSLGFQHHCLYLKFITIAKTTSCVLPCWAKERKKSSMRWIDSKKNTMTLSLQELGKGDKDRMF